MFNKIQKNGIFFSLFIDRDSGLVVRNDEADQVTVFAASGEIHRWSGSDESELSSGWTPVELNTKKNKEVVGGWRYVGKDANFDADNAWQSIM